MQVTVDILRLPAGLRNDPDRAKQLNYVFNVMNTTTKRARPCFPRPQTLNQIPTYMISGDTVREGIMLYTSQCAFLQVGSSN